MALGVLALVAGCAAPTDASEEAPVAGPEHLGTTQQRIFGGAPDDDGASMAGVVALRVGSGGTYELCSGALLAPNVVLTARHCVTKNLTTSVACDENGRSANGKHIASDEEPETIAVFVGASPNFSGRAAAVARTILAPEGDYLCDSDIALVVLDRELIGVEPLAVRLGAPAEGGETIRAVGYGKNDGDAPIGTRFRRENVPVLAMGKGVSASKTPLGPHEFEVARSICQGDSGGPAISETTGAVIGVVSRGGGCDEDFGHIYTTTAGFEDLFAKAFDYAGASPLAEGETAPPMLTRTGSSFGGADLGSEDDEPAAGGCSTGRTSTSGPLGSLAVALAAALVLASRRRSAG